MIKRILFYLFLATLILAASCLNREKVFGFTDAQYYIPELDIYISYSFKEDEVEYRKLHVMISRDSTFEDINDEDHLVYNHTGGWSHYGFYISKYTNAIYSGVHPESEIKNSKHFIFKDAGKYNEYEFKYSDFYTSPCYYFELSADAGRAKLSYYLFEKGEFRTYKADPIIPDATLRRGDIVKIDDRIEYIDIYGNKQYYDILSQEDKTVALVYDSIYRKIKEVAIPSEIMYKDSVYRVKEIGECAFIYCDSLKSIMLPDSLNAIGAWAFYACSSLESINIPHGVSKIEDHTFSKCLSLSSAKLSLNTTIIGEKAFYQCISLKSIKLPNTLNSIGEGAFFSCASLKSVYIPNSVNYLGRCAFVKCSNLKRVQFQNPIKEQNDTLLKLLEYTFYNCEKLESIQWTNSLRQIADKCFDGCSSLKIIILPPQLEVIGYNAFRNCTSLRKITIPLSVSYIDCCVFSNCTSLRYIILESDRPLESYRCTFLDLLNLYEHKVSLIENRFIIYVPNESLELYKTHELWGQMDIKPMSDFKQ